MRLTTKRVALLGLSQAQQEAFQPFFCDTPVDAGEAFLQYYAATGNASEVAQLMMALCVDRRQSPTSWLTDINTLLPKKRKHQYDAEQARAIALDRAWNIETAWEAAIAASGAAWGLWFLATTLEEAAPGEKTTKAMEWAGITIAAANDAGANNDRMVKIMATAANQLY